MPREKTSHKWLSKTQSEALSAFHQEFCFQGGKALTKMARSCVELSLLSVKVGSQAEFQQEAGVGPFGGSFSLVGSDNPLLIHVSPNILLDIIGRFLTPARTKAFAGKRAGGAKTAAVRELFERLITALAETWKSAADLDWTLEGIRPNVPKVETPPRIQDLVNLTFEINRIRSEAEFASDSPMETKGLMVLGLPRNLVQASLSDIEAVNGRNRRADEPLPDAAVTAIQRIHERFAEKTAADLAKTFQTKVTIDLIDVCQETYLEFIQLVYNPSCLTCFRLKGRRGDALLDMNSEMAFRMIDEIQPRKEKRKACIAPLKAAERKTARVLVARILDSFRMAWPALAAHPPIPGRMLSNHTMVQLTKPEANVLVLIFSVVWRRKRFWMTFCLPLKMLKGIQL
jgi:flagellar motor switch protein FliM